MDITFNTKSKALLWCLGNRKPFKVQLTSGFPGPVEIEFNELDLDEMRQVILSIKNNIILITDVELNDLIIIFNNKIDELTIKENPAVISAPVLQPTEEEQMIAIKKANKEKKEINYKAFIDKRREESDLFEQHYLQMDSMIVKSFKKHVGNLKDINYLKYFIKKESSNKKRRTFINICLKRIEQIEFNEQRKKQLNKSKNMVKSTNESIEDVLDEIILITEV